MARNLTVEIGGREYTVPPPKHVGRGPDRLVLFFDDVAHHEAWQSLLLLMLSEHDRSSQSLDS